MKDTNLENGSKYEAQVAAQLVRNLVTSLSLVCVQYIKYSLDISFNNSAELASF
jgi:hypothetical protein